MMVYDGRKGKLGRKKTAGSETACFGRQRRLVADARNHRLRRQIAIAASAGSLQRKLPPWLSLRA
ncbi:MAG TPA: hypothetical protein VGP52_09155 [Stellaceae bacterium]|jgi:hypothetical protein|nr:hypothetical protein [Stellaceae bacterium]